MRVSDPQVRRDSRLFAELSSALLGRGRAVQFRVHGESMQPNLLEGDDVVVVPANFADLHVGDLVLAENADGLRVHRFHSCDPVSGSVILQSDTGHDFDPHASRVFGRVVSRRRGFEEQSLTALQTRFLHPLRVELRRLHAAARLRLRRIVVFFCAIASSLLACAAFLAPAVQAQTADLQLTQTASATAVATSATTQSLGTATTATWAGNVASLTFPTPLPSGVVTNALLTTAGFTPAAYNVTNAAITSVNSATGVVTVALASQSMGTGTATWAGNVASFTFPTPLPANAVVGAPLTTTGFTPAAYNVTNAPITSVNTATGVVTVALPSQSLGTATAATYVSGLPTSHLSFTFPTPLPSEAVQGDLLTTTGFLPGAYNVTNVAITNVPAGGVIQVAIGSNPGGSTLLGTGTVNPSATSTASGTGTVGPISSTTNGTGTVPAGYTYSEVVTNKSSSATVNSGTIIVYMQTPPNTVFESFAGTNWTCTTPTAGNAGPIICTYNTTLASGATASTLTPAFQIVSGTASGTTIQSSATVTNSTFVDTVPSNNTSITSIIVEPTTTSDMALSMSVSPTPVFVSSTLTYTVQVQNLGQAAAPASSNVLTDTLPPSVTFVSYTASAGWSCSGTTTVSCSITSAMAAGTSATITITVTAPTGATTLNNTAKVSLPGDPNSANNSDTAYTVVQPLACATPGRDGLGGTLTGVVNTYYPPASAGTLASGATSVTLGAAQGNTSKPLAAGDLVLIIQMQGATINSTNTSSYGHGVPGDPGAGSTSLGSSGLFEFVTATGFSGTTLTFTGTGPTGGLLNSYSYAIATATQGLQTYQVIRVPQYTSAALSSSLVPLAWPGSTSGVFVGGVLAIDVSSQLTLGGTVALDALGFRGGGGITLAGTTNVFDTDYVTNSPANLPNLSGGDPPAGSGANASKGEGIAGTPHWIAPPLSSITISSTAISTGQTVVEGLPAGSFARGAPGNAGGGATDGHPTGNDYNSGGGAGGNGGTGGQGGYGWNSMAATNTTDGGFGGLAFPASTSALVMGGGGGAGTTNNGTYYISSGNNNHDCGTNCTGIYSSGGAGGGIAIIHTGSVVGTGTITSNGQSTLSTLNDSTGGAGAGGSILLFANSGGLGGLTVNAMGGTAGNAWQNTAPGSFPGQRHGPGGGGGGGVIFLSAAAAASNVAGGSNGYTDTVQDSYGATPGLPGLVQTTHVITETPGTQSGAYCGSADLAVTNSATPTVVLPGGQITYTQTVANNGPLDAVSAVFTEGIPANTTFYSINYSTAPGWTCTTPALGATGTITCTNPDFPHGGSPGTITVIVVVGGGTTSGTQIVDVDNITSGTSDPNLANNTATAITTVASATQADLAVTNTASSPTVTVGSNVTMTAVVTNNGPAAAANATFTETIPTNTTLGVAFTAPAGWTCNSNPILVGFAGTISCTDPSFAANASSSFPIVLNVTAGTSSGTVITDTASVSSSTPDPNYGNNSATATTLVATAGQADLAVASSATPNPVAAGNNITYTQSIIDNGPTSITASGTTTVTFTDAIPANTTLAAAFTAPAGWTCNGSTNPVPVGFAGTISCTLNSGSILGINTSVNFSLVVKVAAGTAAGTIITNSPNISSTVSDPNPANNTATDQTTVASPTQSSVTVTKSASPEPVNQGTTLTYTVMVTNAGPAVAQGIVVTDALPPEVTYIPNAYSTTAGSCSGTTTVTCNLGNLAVGSTAIITINVTAVTFSASSLSTNTAIVTTTSSVPNVPTSLGTATNATWAGGTATFTFPAPLTAGGINSSLTTTGFAPAGYNVTNATIQSVNITTGVITVAVPTNPGAATATTMGSGSSTYPLYASSFSTIQAPTAVDISSFHAFSQLDGSVRVEWRTQEESRNLGFHIYREDPSGRTRIDPSLIAGSALLLHGGRPQHAAKVYAFFDSHPAAPNVAYWVEDVDINGSRTMHGPAYPEFAPTEQSRAQGQVQTEEAHLSSPSLSQLHGAVRLTTGTPRPITTPRPTFPAPPAGTRRFHAADHQAVKISVNQEGWYDIPFSQLFSAGLSPNTDVRSLHLYAEGIEQPLLLVGSSAGPASATDAIEFYGTGIDTPFSATRIYWLVAENANGKRILTSLAASSGVTASASFPFTVIRQDRTTYFAALLNGENNDNFFGDVVTSAPVDETLTVAHRDSSSPASLTLDLSLQGVTDQQQHSVFVQLNGANLGTFDFFGEILASQSFTVDPSQVLDGSNAVTLTALNGDNDVSVVQSVELHYLHTYTADGDWLRATGQAGTEVHISGFTNAQVRVFDITDALNISELNGKIVSESGTYGITVALPAAAPELHTILAFASDALATPLALEQHVPTLDDGNAGADVVMVAYPDFASHLAPLVRLRELQGHHVDVVTTEQIFDEFNYGERSPLAIRAFLQGAATHWRRKPQAVLLVGDASMDPRNYLGFGDLDFVPTRIIETAAFKTASDDWLTDFQQNGFATIPTGRLPVRTTADVDLLVSKIVSYENGEYSGSWNNQALLIADQNIDANFTSAVNSAAATLPASLKSRQFLADGVDPVTFRSQIIAALNNGALLVNYNGHGAEQQWSFSDLFDDTDASALTNGGHLPVYLLMDCLNGLFQDVYAESLAKSLILAPNGGAVAVWASSGFTQEPPQVSMNLAFLHQIAAYPNQPLGRLVLNAKAGTTDNDVRRTWILFGDPSMKLHFSASASSALGSSSAIRLTPPGNSNRACARETACVREIQ